jgi:hypothetical protein
MLTTALLVSAALIAPSATGTPTPTPSPGPTVSIAQVCAATSIAQIDGLLDQVSTSDLVGPLAPLLTIGVPKDADSIEVDSALQLDEVKRKLNCNPGATVTPVPTTVAPPPTTEPPVGGDGNGGVSKKPKGAPETGGEPPTGPTPLTLGALAIAVLTGMGALANGLQRRRR